MTGPLAPECPAPCCTLYRTPNTRHTPGAAAPRPHCPSLLLCPPRSWKLPGPLGRRHAVTCAFLPPCQSCPSGLCYPSPLLALLVPSWQGCHLGPTTPEGYSVVSGLTMGTRWPTSDISPLLPESREWEGCGGTGASSHLSISRPSAPQAREKCL